MSVSHRFFSGWIVSARNHLVLQSLHSIVRPDQVRRRLLAWFARHARDLPWRHDRDPHRIWISEVMLQQTQVATVIPYFERFLQRFPTFSALAQASEQDVLHLWAGLGYYRRARDLIQAARTLHGLDYPTIPNDASLLHTLPGFGRYTVNAVLSQAYDCRLPILEANSRRVLCRLFGIEEDPRQAAVQAILWQLAEWLLPKKNAGNFNQAMMELGALVCTPTRPNCPDCPLAQSCQARLTQRQEQIPPRSKSPETVVTEEVAIVLRRKKQFLLVQRPATGRWAGMWEFPHQPLAGQESHGAAVQRFLRELGIAGDVAGEIATLRHAVTRFQITMTCLEVVYRGGSLRPGAYPESTWVTAEKLADYPLSAPQRQLARCLLERKNC